MVVLKLERKKQHYVKFRDNNRSKVVATRTINKSPLSICNVRLVSSLKYNLLSISKLCYKGHKISFDNDKCIAFDKKNKKKK